MLVTHFKLSSPCSQEPHSCSTVLSVERVWFYKLVLVSGLVKDLIVKTPLTFLLICGDDIFSYLASDHSLTF